MNQDLTRLEELLARIQRNGVRTRGQRFASPGASPMARAPAAPSAPLPPVYTAPPASYSAAPQTYLDPVDELLADPFPASSAPPPPFADAQDEPIPLVSVAVQGDGAISGVMPVAELAEEPEEPEELLEDDIVEMTPTDEADAAAVAPPAQVASFGGDLNFEEGEDPGPRVAPEDEPPNSSSRTRFTASMAEAIAHADEAVELEDGREVPLKTPPPQSGPQAAMAPLPASIHAPAAPNLDSLLEADILPAFAQAAVPTAEQLGQTIELEEGRGPRLELDRPSQVEHVPNGWTDAHEDLEAALPEREFGGGYQDDLMPPPEARADLAAHLHLTSDASLPPPDDLNEAVAETPPARQSGMFAATVGTAVVEEPAHEVASDEIAPELFARPELSPVPVARFIRAEAPRPSTFLELLDASLSLGHD